MLGIATLVGIFGVRPLRYCSINSSAACAMSITPPSVRDLTKIFDDCGTNCGTDRCRCRYRGVPILISFQTSLPWCDRWITHQKLNQERA